MKICLRETGLQCGRTVQPLQLCNLVDKILTNLYGCFSCFSAIMAICLLEKS